MNFLNSQSTDAVPNNNERNPTWLFISSFLFTVFFLQMLEAYRYKIIYSSEKQAKFDNNINATAQNNTIYLD